MTRVSKLHDHAENVLTVIDIVKTLPGGESYKVSPLIFMTEG